MYEQSIAEIRRAISSKDKDALAWAVGDVSEFCFAHKLTDSAKAFPTELFDFLFESLSDPDLLNLDCSYELLMWIEYDWGRFSDDQKRRLLPGLKDAYPNFHHWMAWFVISEVLGEYYASAEAFEVLRSLRSVQDENARAMVPHGFEEIVKRGSDPSLKLKAMAQLSQMREDGSEKVRGEVAESFRRLASNGIRFE
jgi:hypothetical protein